MRDSDVRYKILWFWCGRSIVKNLIVYPWYTYSVQYANMPDLYNIKF